MTTSNFVRLVAAGVLASSAAAQPLPPEPPICGGYDLSFITPQVQAWLNEFPAAQGAGVLIVKDGRVVYERYFGTYTAQTVVLIASASKWPTSALVMTFVDEGSITLDTPVGAVLTEFVPGPLGQITFGRCVSHAAGLPDSSEAISSTTITLRQAAQQIAVEGLRVEAGQPVLPGTDFCYGGVSMHVAGAGVEQLGGRPNVELLADRITGPLLMTSTGFPVSQQANPRIAGGLRSNARDYMNFLLMLLDGGQFGGQQILSPQAVDAVIAPLTGGLARTCVPQAAPEVFEYGVGSWLDLFGKGGEVVQATSPGAFGFNPWIDTQRNLAGVFMVQHSNQAADPLVRSLQAQIRAAMDAGPTPSVADANRDGVVNSTDVSEFINLWFTDLAEGTLVTDFNPDGVINSTDVSMFINTWFVAAALGCGA